MLDRNVSNAVTRPPSRPWRALGAIFALFPLVFLIQQRIARGRAQSDGQFQEQIALSQQLLQLGSARESLVPLERARRARPQAFAVHNNLCFAYGLLRRKDEAVRACERALELEPANQLARNNLRWVRTLAASSAQ